MQIKDPATVGKKYAQNGGSAAAAYAAGVASPRTPWAAATTNAANTYAAGVQASIGAGSFAKGVARAGDSKWARKAGGVGATRFGPGVQAAQSDYVNGITPYLQVLSNLTLPPRGPKGDPGNIARVQAIAQALRAAKLGH